MILDNFLKEYNINNIVSEQDVRTKVAIPLIYNLGYTQDFIANEFPVYGYEGRKKLNTKYVDIMLFSDSGFENYRNDNQTSWVQNHSLIAIELKKPSEKIKESHGQAKFYTMWTRALYYICTNGKEICIYKSENHYADSVLYDGQVANLNTKWLEIQKDISFNSLSSLKENKNKTDTSRPYTNYCLSMMLNNDDFIETWWKQKIYKMDKNIEVTLESLKTTQTNSIILAPSGVGKTTCLNLIFQNYIKNYLNNSSDITPIFLSAKFWKRGFCSIIEGIKKELELLVPNITESIIQGGINQNKYVIFIDGIDECFIEKDVLIDEINKISQSALIFVSCRENFYNKELESFDKYNISELCEKDLIEISTEVLDKDTNHVLRQMDNGLKALIKTPLYFHMWLFYCKNNPDSMIPDNITVLIDNFINYMLKEYISAKGNYNFQELPLSSLKDILAKFAYINFNFEKESIDKIVTESSLKDNTREVIRLFNQSGIISEINGCIDFQQQAIKEYFYTLYVTKLPHKDILDFLSINNHLNEFQEIIFLLIGLTKEEELQRKVLDFLEQNNLPLYIKCLKKRYNFSTKYKNNINQEICNNFFSQILVSYENIINLHFPVFKNFLPPWSSNHRFEDNETKQNIGIKGYINLERLSVEFNFYIQDEKNNKKLDVTFENSTPIITVQKSGENITPLSMTNNQGWFFYDISQLYSGIDCAREIAVKTVESAIFNVFDEDVLIINATPLLQLSYINEVFDKIKNISVEMSQNNIETNEVSLSKYSIDEMRELFKYLHGDIPYERNKSIPTQLIFFMLSHCIENNIDVSQVIEPERTSKINHQSHWMWRRYDKTSFIKWLQTYYNNFQNEYRKMVESLFPTLQNYMSLYSTGPVQFRIDLLWPLEDNMEAQDVGADIYWEPVTDMSLSDTIVNLALEENTDDNRNWRDKAQEIYNKQTKRLKFMSRTPNKIYTSFQSGYLFFGLLQDNFSLKKAVYKQLKKELRDVFKYN